MTRKTRRPTSGAVSRARRTAPVRKLHRALFLAALGGVSLLPKISAQSIAVTGAVTPGTPTSQTSWAPTDIIVGSFAPGSVTVAAGATLTSATGTLGAGTGADGTVTITGPGSSWTLTGGAPSQLIVGNAGVGTLNLLDGGSASSPLLFIGQAATGTGSGTVLVSGAGSQLTADQFLTVGNGSQGFLTVEDGGVVNTSNLFAGFSTSDIPGAGFGRLDITGSGTELNVSEQLVLAYSLGATMHVQNGASLNTAASFIGAGGSRLALVQVSSGGSWNSTGSIAVGYSSSGELIISGGGTVTAPSITVGTDNGGAGSIYIYSDESDGSIGTLETASITKGPGTGSLTIDGGRLRATADGAFISGLTLDVGEFGAYIDTQDFDTTIVGFLNGGDGGLVKEGTGSLIITNGAGYTGVTIVEAGTLRANGFSSSEVIVQAGAVFGTNYLEGDLTIQGGGIYVDNADPLMFVRGVIDFGTAFGIDNLVGLDAFTTSGIFEFIFNEGGDFTTMGLENFGLENAFTLNDGRLAYFQAAPGSDTLNLVVTSAIPEPASTAALVGLGMLGFAALRRRPRR